jgi:hypothetical protein
MFLGSQYDRFPYSYTGNVLFIQWDGESLQDVHFLYRYVIDELVFFGTKEQAVQHHMNLATLLFR